MEKTVSVQSKSVPDTVVSTFAPKHIIDKLKLITVRYMFLRMDAFIMDRYLRIAK